MELESDFQNYFYTLVQIIHNFGAVTVASCALISQLVLFQNSIHLQRKLAWTILFGWTAQGGSGLGFGAVSYFYHRQFPDIHGIAEVSLWVKITCTALGILLSLLYLNFGHGLLPERRKLYWKMMIAIASIALIAAASLRWLS